MNYEEWEKTYEPRANHLRGAEARGLKTDYNNSYSQTPHDPDCPAVDGFGCYCNQTIIEGAA